MGSKAYILLLCLGVQVCYSQLPPIPPTSHPCARPCTGLTRTCSYEFHVEWYTTLTPACVACPAVTSDCFRIECIFLDGIKGRTIQVINRQYPGPKIEVCQGDTIEVRVKNDFKAEATTIHWHGQHQKGTPYMDGVPYITQCPIQPEAAFVYKFIASQAGTHFWHSHLSLQRGNGHFGALIVRQPVQRCDPTLYDADLSEHVIVLSDLTLHPVNDVFINHYFNQIDEYPHTICINGLCRYRSALITSAAPLVPAARFVVTKGKRYRFRMISSASADNPIVCRFTQHTMLIIASDGQDIVPVKTNSLTLLAGERYDFVVTADQPDALYWIFCRGYVEGELGGAFQAAVLQYSGQSSTAYPAGTPTFATTGPFGNQVNGFNMPALAPPFFNVPVDDLRAIVPTNLGGTPALKVIIAFDIEAIFTPRFQLQQQGPGALQLPLTQNPQLNKISMAVPNVCLLSQWYELPPNYFCTEATRNLFCPAAGYCSCPYVHQVNVGDLIELILIDEGKLFDVSHPIHLHGHYFGVVGVGKLGSSTTKAAVQSLDSQGLLKRNFVNPPLKDTVAVPDGGYVIIRFIADNIGIWLMHCHIEFHAELGMAMAFKIGHFLDFPPVPNNFPECRDFLNI